MTLCLIAGQGRLPGLLCDATEVAHVAALEGFAPEGLGPREVILFRLETLGSFLADLSGRGVTRVCFAGAIRRPPVDPSRIDAATMPLVPRMMQAMGQGDDAALRALIAVVEEAGITVVGAQDLLPDLLPPPGMMGRGSKTRGAEKDAARGQKITDAMGAADVGQACVVAGGQALGLEAQPGTNWLLATLAHARADDAPDRADDPPLRRADMAPGGILYKAPKPGQDRRIDLPAIGPDTVRGAAAAQLDGIVIEAGGVMVLDPASVIELADRLDLFIWVRART